MTQRLKNKVALITGGGSGIGAATAKLFANEGAKVALIDQKYDDVQIIADEIVRRRGEVFALAADVADPAQMQHAVRKIIETWDRIDIVFANAGINGVWAPIDELTPEEWNRTITTNLNGTFLTIKYTVPHLKKNGGSIIITSSVNGTSIFSNTGATAYSCSKAAQVAMTKMLALELAKHRVRINVICPGAVKTNISDSTETRDLEKIKIPAHFGTNIPLSDHPASAEQVADLVLFLASEESSHITGTPIWIDGGQSLLQG